MSIGLLHTTRKLPQRRQATHIDAIARSPAFIANDKQSKDDSVISGLPTTHGNTCMIRQQAGSRP